MACVVPCGDKTVTANGHLSIWSVMPKISETLPHTSLFIVFGNFQTSFPSHNNNKKKLINVLVAGYESATSGKCCMLWPVKSLQWEKGCWVFVPIALQSSLLSSGILLFWKKPEIFTKNSRSFLKYQEIFFIIYGGLCLFYITGLSRASTFLNGFEVLFSMPLSDV